MGAADDPQIVPFANLTFSVLEGFTYVGVDTGPAIGYGGYFTCITPGLYSFQASTYFTGNFPAALFLQKTEPSLLEYLAMKL